MKFSPFPLVFIILSLGSHLATPPCIAASYFTESYLVQTGDPSCMQVMWQTDTYIRNCWVRWGYSEDSLEYWSDSPTPEHQNIHNEGLPLQPAQDFISWSTWICAAPGQHVYYKVFVSKYSDYDEGKAESWGVGNFVLPLPPSARHLTFFGYGDTRECGSDFDHVSQAINNAMASDEIDHKTFLLHSGDVVYNGGQTLILYKDNHWMEYFSKYDASKYILHSMPVVVAMGNHDFDWEDYGEYPKYYYIDFPYPQYVESVGFVPYLDDHGKLVGSIDDAYYSFDYGPLHVAVLNAYGEFGEFVNLGGCKIGDVLKKGHAQYDWLEKDLAGTNKPWKVLVMHVSPLSCDCGITDAVRHDLEDLADASGVDLLISGHDHYYSRKEYNAIPHLCLGGGGAELDKGNGCKGLYFHYARFDVVNDGRLDVNVYKVNSDASTTLKDSLSVSKPAPVTTAAGFEASSLSTDYRTPIRFSCTSPGVHSGHEWDFGDGTSSTEENPLHTYPKPTDPSGIQTHTVSLKVYDDAHKLLGETEQDVTVYIHGTLQPIVNVPYNTQYAMFLRQRGNPLDEVNDFRGFYSGEDNPILELPPGDWTLTIRALGYDDWEGSDYLPPGKWLTPYISPHEQSHPHATVAIGSVPTGAGVTVTLGQTKLSGTTPFYAELCCSRDPLFSTECTFDYVVGKNGIKVQGVGDLITSFTPLGCTTLGGLADIFVDLRPPTSEFGISNPLILRYPSNQEVIRGGRARVRVSARSRQTLTYRWYLGESGDTSRPIYGATGPVIITPPLTESKKGWVRVYAGAGSADSPTVSVTVVPPEQGPVLLKATRACRTARVRLCVHGMDQSDLWANRAYFDEFEGIVDAVYPMGCDVTAPLQLADREYVNVQMNVGGVWSNSIRVKVQDCQ